MKDAPKAENSGKRKRKQSDDTWLRKYQQLDIILKSATNLSSKQIENESNGGSVAKVKKQENGGFKRMRKSHFVLGRK